MTNEPTTRKAGGMASDALLEATEDRMYRLALLLLGDHRLALDVLADVTRDQPSPHELDASRLDRLVILRCREESCHTLSIDGVPEMYATCLASLPSQSREAWILARIDQSDDRRMARSMDCSRSATERHLTIADAAFGQHSETAAHAFAEATRGLGLPDDVRLIRRLRRARRRRIRWALRIALVIVLTAAAILIARFVLGGGDSGTGPTP